MKLMVFILNKVDSLENILTKFERNNIHDATILSSQGMATALEGYMDGSFFGSLRAPISPVKQENKTVIAVVKDEQVEIAISIIEDVIGSLEKPDTGVVFTLPVDFIKGINL